MIYRMADSPGLGDIDLVVDPIRVTDTQSGQTQDAGPGALVVAAKPKEPDWAWLIIAGIAGLALGYWLAQEAGRGGGPT